MAHYLRLHLYPGGFHDSTLLTVDRHTLAVEVGRELCTGVVLVAAAALAPGPWIRRVASFVYVFGIWDLSYYAALWLFEGWPASPWDWDLLFLIPVPWLGPVLAPMLISGLGIAAAVALHVAIERRGDLHLPGCAILSISAGLLAWELSFTSHALAGDGPRAHFPAAYPWGLFALGAALALAGGVLVWLANRPARIAPPPAAGRPPAAQPPSARPPVPRAPPPARDSRSCPSSPTGSAG